MAEEYNRALLKSAVGRICQVIGWQVVHGSALETMVDILQRYLLRMGSMSKSYGEIAGRSNAEFCDLAKVMGEMGVSVNDLKIFTQEVETMPPQHSVFDTQQEVKLKHFRPKRDPRMAPLNLETDTEEMPEEMDIDSDESDELLQYLPPMVSRSNTDTIPDDELGGVEDAGSPSCETLATNAATATSADSTAAQRTYDEESRSESPQAAASLVGRKQSSVPSQVPPNEDRLTMPQSVASQYLQEAYTGLHAVISVDSGTSDTGADAQTAKRPESSQPSASSEQPPPVSKPAGPVVKKGRGRPPGKTQKTLQKLAELAIAKAARKNKAKAASPAKGSPKSKLAASSKAASPLLVATAGPDSVKLGQTPPRPAMSAPALATPAPVDEASPAASALASQGGESRVLAVQPASVLPAFVQAASDAQRKKKPQGHSSSSKSDKKLLKKKKRKEKSADIGPFPAPAARPGVPASPPASAGDSALRVASEPGDQKPLVITLGNLHRAKQPAVEAPGAAADSKPRNGGADSGLASANAAQVIKKKKKKKHHRQQKDPSGHSEGNSQKKSSLSKSLASSSGRHAVDAMPPAADAGKMPGLSSTPVKSREVASHGEPTSTTPQRSAASTVTLTPTAVTPAKGSSLPSSLAHTPDAKKSSKSSSKKKPPSVHGTPQSDSKKKHKRKRKHNDDPTSKSSAEPPAKKKRKKKPEEPLAGKPAGSAGVENVKRTLVLTAPSGGISAATSEVSAKQSFVVDSIQFSPVADSPESQVPSTGPGWPTPARKLGALDRLEASLAGQDTDLPLVVAVNAATAGPPGAAVDDVVAPTDAARPPAVLPVTMAGITPLASDNVYLCPICHRPDDGGVMITCEKCNNDKWYHIGCVGLLAAPTDNEKWFCPPCRKKADKKVKKKKKEHSQPKGNNPPPVKIRIAPLPPPSGTDSTLPKASGTTSSS